MVRTRCRPLCEWRTWQAPNKAIETRREKTARLIARALDLVNRARQGKLTPYGIAV